MKSLSGLDLIECGQLNPVLFENGQNSEEV